MLGNMTDRRGVFAALVIAASLTLGGPAGAVDKDKAEAQSRALFEKAQKAVVEGRLNEACPLFQAAHDINSTGGTAINAADCYEKTAQYDKALGMYQYILDHKDKEKTPDRIKVAEAKVPILRKQLGLDKDPPPKPTVTATAPPPPPPPPKPVPDRRPAYVLFGVGGLGVVLGAVMGGVALQKAGAAKGGGCGEDLQSCPNEATRVAVQGDKDAAVMFSHVSTAALSVGVAGAVVGIILYASGNPKMKKAGQMLGPNGLTYQF